MPYCTCGKCHIALTAKSYCTNCKRTSGKSIAKDQRTSWSHSESIGLCRNRSIERMAGRVAAEAPRGSSDQMFFGRSRIINRLVASEQHIYQGKPTAQLLWHGNK